MKYDVIKSTDQLMGIWGLGNIKQGEEMKMTVSTDNDEANNRDEAQPLKHYWQSDDGRHVIYCADCLTVLPHLTGVDAVVTDPPYGVKGDQNTANAQRAVGRKNDYASVIDCEDVVRRVAVPAVTAALKIAKRGIVTPGNRWLGLYPPSQSFGCFYQPASVGLQPWGRCDSQPILYYGKHPLGGQSIPGQKLAYQLTESPEDFGHPCTKPIRAWTKIVMTASLPEETILDPFMGSGTTGVACIRTGRKFIGIEIEPKYCEIAKQRMIRELSQPCLPTMEPEKQAKQAEMI